MSNEQWPTVEAIGNAKERLRARMPGWQRPAAYGITLVTVRDAEPHFPVVNVPVHELPALVLSLITGRRAESGTFEMTPSELDAAIALLAPAEAAQMYNHPNLACWRAAARTWEADPTARLLAVFLADLDEHPDRPFEAALRRQVLLGNRNADVFVDPPEPSVPMGPVSHSL